MPETAPEERATEPQEAPEEPCRGPEGDRLEGRGPQVGAARQGEHGEAQGSRADRLPVEGARRGLQDRVRAGQEEATRWQTEAETWRTKAVSSRVETLAAADFADPSDALAAIDPAKYLGAGGEIDEAAIKADLAALLERKPHWRRASDSAARTRIPAPNPAQGSGVNGKAAADPATEFAAILRAQLGT
jgi:hypothetical protein